MSIVVDIHKKLNGFSLDIAFDSGNETLGLLGSSGCGKSMTLKCIAGIETPDSGKIVLNGRVLFDSARNINLTPQERRTGYLFQNYALFPHLTVAENIAIGIVSPNGKKQSIVEEKIAAFYLDGLADRYPLQLSGGQQQRVALARIFASSPEIIMLDEPFSALDSHLKWQVERETMKLLVGYNRPIILVSHSRDEVYRICDKTAVMAAGKLECLGTKQDLFANPQTLAASKLTGCKNHSRAKKINDYKIEAIDWKIVLTTDQVVPDDIKYIGIRAHFISLCKDNNSNNTFAPQILDVIEDTFDMMVVVRTPNGTTDIMWELRKEEWQSLQGDLSSISLKIDHNKLLLLR